MTRNRIGIYLDTGLMYNLVTFPRLSDRVREIAEKEGDYTVAVFNENALSEKYTQEEIGEGTELIKNELRGVENFHVFFPLFRIGAEKKAKNTGFLISKNGKDLKCAGDYEKMLNNSSFDVRQKHLQEKRISYEYQNEYEDEMKADPEGVNEIKTPRDFPGIEIMGKRIEFRICADSVLKSKRVSDLILVSAFDLPERYHALFDESKPALINDFMGLCLVAGKRKMGYTEARDYLLDMGIGIKADKIPIREDRERLLHFLKKAG